MPICWAELPEEALVWRSVGRMLRAIEDEHIARAEAAVAGSGTPGVVVPERTDFGALDPLSVALRTLSSAEYLRLEYPLIAAADGFTGGDDDEGEGTEGGKPGEVYRRIVEVEQLTTPAARAFIARGIAGIRGVTTSAGTPIDFAAGPDGVLPEVAVDWIDRSGLLLTLRNCIAHWHRLTEDERGKFGGPQR